MKRAWLVLSLLLVFCLPLLATTPSLNGAVCSGTFVAPGTTTNTITCSVSSGTNQMLEVQIVWNGSGTASTISSVTWDAAGVNEAFTKIQDCANGTARRTSTWRRLAPTALSSKLVTVVFSAAPINGGIAQMVWQNVDQTTPVDTTNMQCGTGSSTTPSVTVTSTAGSVVSGMVSNSTGLTVTAANGQTNLYNFNGTTQGRGDYVASSASVTFGHTLSASGSWAEQAYTINADATGGTSNLLTLGVGDEEIKP